MFSKMIYFSGQDLVHQLSVVVSVENSNVSDLLTETIDLVNSPLTVIVPNLKQFCISIVTWIKA
jgi:hypothetical protein